MVNFCSSKLHLGNEGEAALRCSITGNIKSCRMAFPILNQQGRDQGAATAEDLLLGMSLCEAACPFLGISARDELKEGRWLTGVQLISLAILELRLEPSGGPHAGGGSV